MKDQRYTLLIHDDEDGMLWGEVKELPGCFASGADMDELLEAAKEAINLCLTESDNAEVVELGSHRDKKQAQTYAVRAAELELEAL
jgi:predicted RNase H-like HicB family nuclease